MVECELQNVFAIVVAVFLIVVGWASFVPQVSNNDERHPSCCDGTGVSTPFTYRTTLLLHATISRCSNTS
jgi:hypothetical protein